MLSAGEILSKLMWQMVLSTTLYRLKTSRRVWLCMRSGKRRKEFLNLLHEDSDSNWSLRNFTSWYTADYHSGDARVHSKDISIKFKNKVVLHHFKIFPLFWKTNNSLQHYNGKKQDSFHWILPLYFWDHE